MMMERIASEPSIEVISLLKRLHALLKHTTLCATASWATGWRLVQVCAAVLRTHENVLRMHALGDVLLHIWQHFHNVDIRDQGSVRLYTITFGSSEFFSFHCSTLPLSVIHERRWSATAACPQL
jgi:hypothetical protein